MNWRPCFDYIDKPCGWWEPGSGEGCPLGGDWVVLSSGPVPPGCRLLWTMDLGSPVVAPTPGAVEVRWELRVCGDWLLASERLPELPEGWQLLLDGSFEGDNDDLGDLDVLLGRARVLGCGGVAMVSPEGLYSYRYRFVSLVRYLCDERRLKFGVLEVHERHNSDYLNRYFASQFCCRGMVRPRGGAVKKLGLEPKSSRPRSEEEPAQ